MRIGLTTLFAEYALSLQLGQYDFSYTKIILNKFAGPLVNRNYFMLNLIVLPSAVWAP